MRRLTLLVLAVATLAGVTAYTATATRLAAQEAAPVFVTKIPPATAIGSWSPWPTKRANSKISAPFWVTMLAIKAYREGKLPFREGAIVARIAWRHVPSEENNKVFGREQSFVAGEAPPWYLQFMVKDSKKYAATGGWGYAQFDKNGKSGPQSDLKKCFPCQQAIKDRDFVFTRYSP